MFSYRKDDLEVGLVLFPQAKKDGIFPNIVMCRCIIGKLTWYSNFLVLYYFLSIKPIVFYISFDIVDYYIYIYIYIYVFKWNSKWPCLLWCILGTRQKLCCRFQLFVLTPFKILVIRLLKTYFMFNAKIKIIIIHVQHYLKR